MRENARSRALCSSAVNGYRYCNFRLSGFGFATIIAASLRDMSGSAWRSLGHRRPNLRLLVGDLLNIGLLARIASPSLALDGCQQAGVAVCKEPRKSSARGNVRGLPATYLHPGPVAALAGTNLAAVIPEGAQRRCAPPRHARL